MIKKYYILVLTFLCLFLGQVSYGQGNGDYYGGEDEYDEYGDNDDFTHGGINYSEINGVLYYDSDKDGIPDTVADHDPRDPSEQFDFDSGDNNTPPDDTCYSCDCDPFFCTGGDPANDPTLDICDLFPSYCDGSDDTAEDLESLYIGSDTQQTIGTPYVPKPDDKKIVNIIDTMPIQIPNTCVTSSLEYVSKVLGNIINEGVFILNQFQKGKNVLKDGVDLTDLLTLINTYFNTEIFLHFKDSINSGYPVMTNIYVNTTSSHNVVIVGYQTDGNLIYMDPEKGSLLEAPAANFNTNYAIPIKSVK